VVDVGGGEAEPDRFLVATGELGATSARSTTGLGGPPMRGPVEACIKRGSPELASSVFAGVASGASTPSELRLGDGVCKAAAALAAGETRLQRGEGAERLGALAAEDAARPVLLAGAAFPLPTAAAAPGRSLREGALAGASPQRVAPPRKKCLESCIEPIVPSLRAAALNIEPDDN